MTNSESVADKRITISLDATMLDTFLLCPMKFFYRHKLNRATPNLAKPLDRGQLIHTGFEHYFKAIQSGLQFSSAVEAMINGYNLSALESELESEDLCFIKDRMLESCRINRDQDYRFEILAVEESFAYELFADEFIRIIMIGKIDLLVNDKDYKALPIDHKSYERDFPVHRKTNQFLNYTYATGSNYLMVNRVGMQTSIPPEKKHKRVILSYDPQFHEQWKQNVIKWMQFYLECEAKNEFPLNDTSCDKYNRLCEYYSICDTSGDEGKNFKLQVNFKEIPPWDVAKSLGKIE
jgi:hypothetical protein